MKIFMLRSRCRNLLLRIYSLCFLLIGLLPRNKNLVMFESYSGKQYSCNPRAIFEYLQDNKKKYHYKLVWSVDKRNEELFEKLGVDYITRFSIRWLWYMATAKYWVSNSRLPLWIPKPAQTLYIQTWHGTPLKKLANDMEQVHMPGTTTIDYKRNFIKESNKWDYLISPNSYSTSIFKKAFQYKKNIIETGYPRNDFLYKYNNESAKNDILKKIKLPNHKKIILYAPTWRDDEFYSIGHYKFSLPLELEQMKKALGDSCVILLRMHYLVSENFHLDNYNDFVVDVSKYEDIRELYLISDMLITDYSSVFFDFANLKKPIIFFTYDLLKYRDQLRGFYFNITEEAPGVLVQDSDSLIREIKKMLHNPILEVSYDRFYERFCSLEDGFASKRVVEQIF
ncbi:CDP-glycerol:poly(glycerophosphate) glycerophosphotransferase [Bacillus subtilis]|nr:CDP-glycerol:poly(glycerophosphate) glycerophosphotransferase [Bacillus subtilis]RPK19890.1 CDP-glycerol:poly(glycerophosphate) glycerophosphotransferase [Bacillus subtilis]